MLLDQQRTKRMVKIVSIICALAFVGVLPVVLGIIIFGDNDPTGQEQVISDAESRLKTNPNDIQAMVDLSIAYRNSNRIADADRAIQQAIDLPPKTVRDAETVAYALADTPQKQLNVMKTFTSSHPKNAEGWLILGRLAEQQSQALQARLAYGRALSTAGANKEFRQEAQEAIERVATMGTSTGLTPTTPGDLTVTQAP